MRNAFVPNAGITSTAAYVPEWRSIRNEYVIDGYVLLVVEKFPGFFLKVARIKRCIPFCEDNSSSVTMARCTLKSISSPELTQVPMCSVQFCRSNGHRE